MVDAMTAAVIVQARMGRKRFPGKVLADLCGRPMLWHVLTRCLMIDGADMVVLAVPDEPESEPLAVLAKGLGVSVFSGPEADVLKRYACAARLFDADIIMRITGDCPLIDPVICGEVLAAVKRPGIGYASNLMPRTFERGLDCEAFTRRVLEQAAHTAMSPYDREHCTPWMQRSRSVLKVNIESVEAANDLDDEVEIGRLVEQLAAVVCAIGEEMLDLRPALADGIEDRLRAGAVGDVGGRQIDHQEAAIGVDSNVPVAAHYLLGRAIASLGGQRRLDRLAVEDAGARARLATGRSRSTITAKSWMVRNRSSRTKRRNHQYTVCHGGKCTGSIRHSQPERTM